MKKNGFLVLLVAITSWNISHAAALLIDFETDTIGAVPNGFSSVTAPGAHFTDTLGADLQLQGPLPETDGVSLLVFGDDPSALQIDFDSPQASISLDFGNDDPAFSAAGDVAHLSLWMDAVFVDEVIVVLNRDDIMNQTIQYSGSNFNRAVFAYTDPGLNPINLIEVVDNIAIASGGLTPDDYAEAVPVPTMTAWGAALLVALFGLIGLRQRMFI